MDVKQIRERYYTEPFEPFVLHVKDGRDILVIGRDFIAISPSGREVIVGHPEDDSFAVIDLSTVRDLTQPQKPKSDAAESDSPGE